jgi:hypothetical protein
MDSLYEQLKSWVLWRSQRSTPTSWPHRRHPLIFLCHRIDLSLDARLEYLTLAVGNAKSHPISVGGRHETAIAFLTDLEEKLEVAQVQLEVYNTLVPHLNDPGEVGEKVKILSKTLLTMSEVSIFLVLHR